MFGPSWPVVMDHWPLQWFMTYWISKLSKCELRRRQQQIRYDSICCMNCNLTFPFNKFQTKKEELLVVPLGSKWLNYKSVQSNLKKFQSCFLANMDLRHDRVELFRGWKTVTIIMLKCMQMTWRPWHEYNEIGGSEAHLLLPLLNKIKFGMRAHYTLPTFLHKATL